MSSPSDPSPSPSSGRYSRQELFAPIGPAGQQRLSESRAVVIGCGGLGSVVAELLARAGVGALRIVDRDFVELGNLQRQALFDEADARDCLPKAVAARRKLQGINPECKVDACVADAEADTIRDLLQGADLVIDGTDNLEARYLLNDAAVEAGLPWVHGAAVGSSGTVVAFEPGQGPCYRCLFAEPPPAGVLPNCDTAGVISPAVHAVASLQSALALGRLAAGRFPPAGRRLVTLDCWTGEFRSVGLPARGDPECPTCGRREFPYLRAELGSEAVTLCGRNAVQIRWRERREPDLAALAERLAKVGEVMRNPHLLRVRVPEAEITVFPDGRAIIVGAATPEEGRTLYARYMG